MNPWTSKLVIGSLLGAMGTYGALFYPSFQGYGYAGYGGFHRGPSIWYWGGVDTYHDPSVRRGSRGGPSVRGGGVHGGK